MSPDAATLYSQSDLICKVQRPFVNEQTGKNEIAMMKPGSVLITFFAPLVNHDIVQRPCRRQDHQLQHGRHPAHHTRPEHGRSFLDEHCGRAISLC